MSPNGIATVARLELIQRTRGARWYIALALWVALIAGVTALTWAGLSGSDLEKGGVIFDVVLFFVLGLGMLVVPALTSTSVNGDRQQGVLATLQTTLLTPTDIILGKLLAAFVVAMAFLLTSVPFVLLALTQGGVDLIGAARVILVMAAILLVVCALGLMFSTLVSRPVGSAVLTYLVVAGLTFLTTIVFAMTALMVTDEEEVTVYGISDAAYQDAGSTPPACERYTDTREVTHTERIWPLLAVNPFVVVADAGPKAPDDQQALAGFTPLRAISLGARMAKAGPAEVHDECWGDTVDYGQTDYFDRAEQESPIWPYGLALYALIGAAATWVAIRRVHTPIRRLPAGTRIA